ncbi:MAG: hypothetical protein HC809_07125 [Gammaproteobacteria bacterium]|nr:hypothetical protein [Gammaproteobacteria bacterium]
MYTARLTAVEQHAGDIRIIRLAATAAFNFKAGQYLRILTGSPGDGRAIPFSIASAPRRSPELELHYKPIAGSADATAMNALLASTDSLSFDGPHGDVWIDESFVEPLTILAGGTGISQAHAIVDQLRPMRRRATVELIWSVARASDAFCASFFEEVADHRNWFGFERMVDDADHTGAEGWLSARDAPLTGAVLLAGSPGFVYAMADLIGARGWRPDLRADAFSYAPRS